MLPSKKCSEDSRCLCSEWLPQKRQMLTTARNGCFSMFATPQKNSQDTFSTCVRFDAGFQNDALRKQPCGVGRQLLLSCGTLGQTCWTFHFTDLELGLIWFCKVRVCLEVHRSGKVGAVLRPYPSFKFILRWLLQRTPASRPVISGKFNFCGYMWI